MAKNRKRRFERKVEHMLLRLGERAWRRQIWRHIRHIEARLGEIEEARIVAKYRKRAVDIGLEEAEGEMLLKAHRGDPGGLAFLEQKIKALKGGNSPPLPAPGWSNRRQKSEAPAEVKKTPSKRPRQPG